MNYQELALSFSCHDDALFGILSLPERPARRGVLVVVGGPQYRAGSHRQFTELARTLAQQGIAAMRFDYRGMGDSQGDKRDFEAVGDDLRAAVDQFTAAVPDIDEVVIWGLCDAASAAMFYAGSDPRVTGLVLLNPWVRTTSGLAKATLKHYYRARLLDPEFWKKVARGHFNYVAAGSSLLKMVSNVLNGGVKAINEAHESAPLPERMLTGIARFQGKVLLILSGTDLTAQEFRDLANSSPQWTKLLNEQRVMQQSIADADHTFSRRIWKEQVAQWTGEWMRTL